MINDNDDLLKYHIEQTNMRFDRLEKKLDRVLDGYLMALGGCVVISAIIGYAVSLLNFGFR